MISKIRTNINKNRLKWLLVVFLLAMLLLATLATSVFLHSSTYYIWSLKIERNFTEQYPNMKLKQIILNDCPELKSKNITDYQKICIIRNWAANVIDCSDFDLTLDRRIANFYSLTAYEIYQLFDQDKGGVWCAGSSEFLKKALRLFGFEAYDLYYGFKEPGGYTHAVTLVKIQEGESEILSVQDAYFNTTYELSTGEPLDYFELLRLLKEKRDNEIVLVEPTTPLMREWHRIIDLGGNKYEIETTRSLFTFYTVIGHNAERMSIVYAFLERNHLPQNEIYLHLFPYYCAGSKEMLEKAKQIAGLSSTLVN